MADARAGSLREMRIAELSLELRQISKAKKAWRETGDPWEPPLLTEATSALESTVYAMLPVVASEEDLLSIMERERVIRQQIDTLRQEIARAQARGVYEDFSHLHQLYSQHDSGGPSTERSTSGRRSSSRKPTTWRRRPPTDSAGLTFRR